MAPKRAGRKRKAPEPATADTPAETEAGEAVVAVADAAAPAALLVGVADVPRDTQRALLECVVARCAERQPAVRDATKGEFRRHKHWDVRVIVRRVSDATAGAFQGLWCRVQQFGSDTLSPDNCDATNVAWLLHALVQCAGPRFVDSALRTPEHPVGPDCEAHALSTPLSACVAGWTAMAMALLAHPQLTDEQLGMDVRARLTGLGRTAVRIGHGPSGLAAADAHVTRTDAGATAATGGSAGPNADVSAGPPGSAWACYLNCRAVHFAVFSHRRFPAPDSLLLALARRSSGATLNAYVTSSVACHDARPIAYECALHVCFDAGRLMIGGFCGASERDRLRDVWAHPDVSRADGSGVRWDVTPRELYFPDRNGHPTGPPTRPKGRTAPAPAAAAAAVAACEGEAPLFSAAHNSLLTEMALWRARGVAAAPALAAELAAALQRDRTGRAAEDVQRRIRRWKTFTETDDAITAAHARIAAFPAALTAALRVALQHPPPVVDTAAVASPLLLHLQSPVRRPHPGVSVGDIAGLLLLIREYVVIALA